MRSALSRVNPSMTAAIEWATSADCGLREGVALPHTYASVCRRAGVSAYGLNAAADQIGMVEASHQMRN